MFVISGKLFWRGLPCASLKTCYIKVKKARSYNEKSSLFRSYCMFLVISRLNAISGRTSPHSAAHKSLLGRCSLGSRSTCPGWRVTASATGDTVFPARRDDPRRSWGNLSRFSPCSHPFSNEWNLISPSISQVYTQLCNWRWNEFVRETLSGSWNQKLSHAIFFRPQWISPTPEAEWLSKSVLLESNLIIKDSLDGYQGTRSY